MSSFLPEGQPSEFDVVYSSQVVDLVFTCIRMVYYTSF